MVYGSSHVTGGQITGLLPFASARLRLTDLTAIRKQIACIDKNKKYNENYVINFESEEKKETFTDL